MLRILIKGPNNTSAVLSDPQFHEVRHIIVKMMSNGITRRRAEVMIAERLVEKGIPLEFVDRSKHDAN